MAAEQTPVNVVCLPPPDAATAVARAWERSEAVAVLDPRAPASKRAQAASQLPRNAPPGVAALVSTSGTTGQPRLVELTAASMSASAQAVSAVLGVTERDRWLACVPLHHVAGLAIMRRCFEAGTSVTVLDRFDVEEVCRALPTCTLVSLVPTMLSRLLDAGAPLKLLRRVIVGGAPLSEALAARASKAGVELVTSYGLTETNGGCLHDGRPLADIDISLSASGEVLVRGPVVMRGYHGDSEATREAFTENGWLRTGDIGRLDDEGRLVVTDRLKDLIVSGGVNVAPSAVEGVLARHPAVAEVCVAGLPDEDLGEVVTAFVVARERGQAPGQQELRAFASEWLSPSEVPRRVVEVESIPRTASGKVTRRLMAR